MNKEKLFFLLPVACLFLFLGCGESQPAETTTTAETIAVEPGTLVSVKVDEAPVIDAKNPDAAWADAPELNLQLAGGANFSNGTTDLRLKSVYDDAEIFFMVQWMDPTESLMSTPMEKQDDGSWKMTSYKENFEDQVAFIWNINDSIKDFNTRGCAVACHPGEGIPIGGDLGKMYTAGPGEVADMWKFKAARTDSLDLSPTINTYVEDWAMDWLNVVDINIREAAAGQYPDPGEDAYIYNLTPDKQSPMYQWKNLPDDPGARNFLFVDNVTEFNELDWKSGDRLPILYILRNPSGDRADIIGASHRSEGKWTLVFKRKLVTGSTANPPVDIQFTDLNKPYRFGVAAFDNNVQHAFYSKTLTLQFRGTE